MPWNPSPLTSWTSPGYEVTNDRHHHELRHGAGWPMIADTMNFARVRTSR